jgi:hypothetical protein
MAETLILLALGRFFDEYLLGFDAKRDLKAGLLGGKVQLSNLKVCACFPL